MTQGALVKRMAIFSALALLASGFVVSSPASAQHNYAGNSRFMYWSRVAAFPFTVGGGGGQGADEWWIGPGVGNAVTVNKVGVPDVVQQDGGAPNGIAFALYVRWSSGAFDPAAGYGATWLEHYMFEIDALQGRAVTVSFWGRVDGGSVYVVPVLWTSYRGGWSGVVEGQGCVLTTTYTKCSAAMTVPAMPARAADPGYPNYVGVGLNFVYPTAPGIYISRFEVVR